MSIDMTGQLRMVVAAFELQAEPLGPEGHRCSEERQRRFSEYAALERETGSAVPSGTYSAVEVRYRLAM
jgi:hypothetical protein